MDTHTHTQTHTHTHTHSSYVQVAVLETKPNRQRCARQTGWRFGARQTGWRFGEEKKDTRAQTRTHNHNNHSHSSEEIPVPGKKGPLHDTVVSVSPCGLDHISTTSRKVSGASGHGGAPQGASATSQGTSRMPRFFITHPSRDGLGRVNLMVRPD